DGLDRQALPPPGRDRHAVVRHGRRRFSRGPRGHGARPRLDDPGAGERRPIEGEHSETPRRCLMNWLLLAGPVIFVGGFLVLGKIRPSYNPLYTFVSQLALNGGGLWQTANFLLSVLLIV